MKIILHPTGGKLPVIRPAPLARAWMDATPERYAYRCLPLAMANRHGWEVLLDAPVRAIWRGGASLLDLRVELEQGPGLLHPCSHFGSGILTFHLPFIVRTEPGWNTWVQGPANDAKLGAAALSGLAETDHAYQTFTMNWRLLEAGREAVWAAGDPICCFWPAPRGWMDGLELAVEEAPAELQAAHKAWAAGRSRFNAALEAREEAAVRQKWQKSYQQAAIKTRIFLPELK